jgi:predicted transcriptional regulator
MKNINPLESLSPMAVKLNKIIEKNGLKKKWIAKKLGISQGALCKFLLGKGKLPGKSWYNLTQLTQQKITIHEIMDFYAERKQDQRDQRIEKKQS